MKVVPIGAKLFVIKGINFILNIKLRIDPVPIHANIPKAIKEDGT